MPPRFIDLTGRTFGRLTAIHLGPRTKQGRSTWNCSCSCGRTKNIRLRSLLDGSSKSCGCLQRELMSVAQRKRPHRTTHGMTNTSEYRIWNAMLQRCRNPNDKNHKDYGGRGINVCDDWLKFDNFIRDMGQRPHRDLTIERTDNDNGYSKSNCRWATRKEQRANQRSANR